MTLLVSSPTNPCGCTNKTDCKTTSELVTTSPGNPYIEKHYPSRTIEQYVCCANLWYMQVSSDPGVGFPSLTMDCQVSLDTILNWIFEAFWGDGSEQEIVYQESGSISVLHTTFPSGLRIPLHDPNWILVGSAPPEQFAWTCPSTVKAKTYPNIYFSLQITASVGFSFSNVRFPQVTFYTCPSQACQDVPSNISTIGGDDCLTQWQQSETPKTALVQPGNCGVKCYFTCQGISSGTFPGFTIEEMYLRNLGNFTYSYNLALDGVNLINQNGNINVPGYTADIAFNLLGWYVWGAVWRFDYTGPISSNPTVTQVFRLSVQRCIYRPKLPVSTFATFQA